jgi:hypothetical protein
MEIVSKVRILPSPPYRASGTTYPPAYSFGMIRPTRSVNAISTSDP